MFALTVKIISGLDIQVSSRCLHNFAAAMLVSHTCQPQEYKNLETSRNLCIVRESFSTMSRNTLRKSPENNSECFRRVLFGTAFTYRIVPVIFNDKMLSDFKVLHVLSTS